MIVDLSMVRVSQYLPAPSFPRSSYFEPIAMESYKPQRPSPSDSTQSHGSRDEELVNKASAPVANHTGSPPAGSEQKTSAAKRLACDQCRQRKVKCNKEYPQCSRCAKVDIGCTYSTRKKTSPEKMGLSHFLLTLNSRLGEYF
jgi:hypothetical protein